MKIITALAAIALAAATMPALAIDFDSKILTIDGQDFRDERGAAVNITLGSVAQNVLLNVDDKSLNGEQKMKRWLLAKKIHEKPKDPDISIEDIALIKTLIGNNQPPAVSGPAWQLLDPAAK